MSLSRREFFQGAAATGAALATGGTGAVAGGVARAGAIIAGAGATFKMAGSMAEKVELAQKILGTKSGGYPFHAISAVFRQIFHQPNAGYSQIDISHANRVKDILMGNGEFFRHGASSFPDKAGKIDFSIESILLARFRELPDEIPLDVLLSDELYDTLEKGGLHSDMASPEQRQFLKDILLSIAGEGVTAQELKKALEGHFARLARHAISNPGDFPSYGYMGHGGQDGADNVIVYSNIKEISQILRRSSGDEYAALAGDVEKAMADHIRDFEKYAHYERIQKNAQQLEEEGARTIQRARELREQKRLDPFMRATRGIDLRYLGQNRFVVQLERRNTKPSPLRIDWYHWVESLDPENKKICDIGLDETGAILTVKNSVVLDFLKKALAKERGTVVTIDLPNRRAGVDLNDASPEMP